MPQHIYQGNAVHMAVHVVGDGDERPFGEGQPFRVADKEIHAHAVQEGFCEVRPRRDPVLFRLLMQAVHMVDAGHFQGQPEQQPPRFSFENGG